MLASREGLSTLVVVDGDVGGAGIVDVAGDGDVVPERGRNCVVGVRRRPRPLTTSHVADHVIDHVADPDHVDDHGFE